LLRKNIEDAKKVKRVVLSASRMTDMPKFYPKDLIEEVETRLKKGIDIHTLVLWSKHPDSLLSGELYEYLIALKNKEIQLYYQCTITGMGSRVIGANSNGSNFILEPGVPNPYKAIKDLEKVIELLENPLRVKLRIDPIIRIKNALTNEVFTNLVLAEEIMRETAKMGIKNYTFSFLENNVHNKVDRRFKEYEWKIITPSNEEKEKVYTWFREKGDRYGVNIQSCCVPGLSESRCIDGYLLNSLHDKKYEADLNEQRKRELCACTSSIDMGGWPTKKCYSGCKYCYANASLDKM
jgi:DNA repair photolyase